MDVGNMAKMTKEQLFFKKLKDDFPWYAENFLKIRDKKANIVDFRLNKAQRIVFGHIEELRKNNMPVRILLLKARQMGMSTFTEGFIFHDTSTNENKNALIIAHEESASGNLFNMSKMYYEYLPDVIRPMKKYANGKVLQFENPTAEESEKMKNPGLRSKIAIATAGAGEVGRSATYHNLHVSELAFFPDPKITMLGLMQCVPDAPNTNVIIESTANGVGDYFHEMWQAAEKGLNDFVPIFLPWFIQDEYVRPFRTEGEKQQLISEVETVTKDSNGNNVYTYEKLLKDKQGLTWEQLNWRRYTIANKCQGDEELFMQEYPSTPEEAFISSGRPKFNIPALRKYQTITKEPIARGYLQFGEKGTVKFVDDVKGYISIWKKPEKGVHYAVGADVAEGLIDGDFSCGIVGDDHFDVVAMWHGHIDPDLFGLELVKLGIYYHDAYLGVESNNHGLTTLMSIKKQEYWNLYFTKTFDKISETMTQKLGWQTNLRTKPLMIDKLAEFIREFHLGIYSDLLIAEAFTYIIEDNGKTNAQSGCHDDTIMACAIMLQLLLEGKGESYTPEIPVDQRKDIRAEVLDELFEKENNEEFAL
jgi:hypothetical protein